LALTFALLAFLAVGVVFTIAGHLARGRVQRAGRGVAVTFATAADGQVRDAYVGVLLAAASGGLDGGEDDLDIRGCDPILEDGAVLEVLRGGSIGQGGEGDSGA